MHDYEEVVIVQASVQEHGVNIEDQANYPMEEDNNVDNTFEEDGENRLLEDKFNNVGMDDDGNQYEGGYDIHVLERGSQPLYEGLETSLLSAILLVVNLKVVNGL